MVHYDCAGREDLGLQLLQQFKWGEGFFDLNRDLLEAYSKCKDAADVIRTQEQFLATAAEKKTSDRGFKKEFQSTK